MNKLESFVENFDTTSLESSESACICRSTIGMRRMHTSIDDQAQIASQRFPTVSNVFKTTYSVFQHEQNGGEATAWVS